MFILHREGGVREHGLEGLGRAERSGARPAVPRPSTREQL
jgi:hypothetical protein